jgi:hypothetical protein
MEQKDKDLLIRNLCASLPYRVMLSYDGEYGKEINPFPMHELNRVTVNTHYEIEGIKPYLRSVYTMTEEEMDKLFDILHIDKDGNDEDWIKINDVTGIKFFLPAGRWMEEIDEAMSYLRSIHIDINGLISKGLALEAPEGMYNIK